MFLISYYVIDLVIKEPAKRESTEIKISGLSSLEAIRVATNSFEVYFSIRNLPSLKEFHLSTPKIDENIISQLLLQIPNIEELLLNGKLNYFSLDDFVNLRCLCLSGTLKDDFNFELFKKLSYQLESLIFLDMKQINLNFFDYEMFVKLLNGHIFSNLKTLYIDGGKIMQLEKKFIDQFPSLVRCRIINCCIEIIEDKAFSNLKKLIYLDLSDNLLERIYKSYFSDQLNRLKIILQKNPLRFVENGISFTDNRKCECLH